MDILYDVIVLGAGPAGLSGALVLGRCARRVLVCDDGKPRNAPSRAVHGFLSRDGTPPSELLRAARADLARYPSVEFRRAQAVDVGRDERSFWAKLHDGAEIRGHKLLIATGLIDELPQIPGLAERWGRSVFPCPFCDAWEYRDKPMAVLATDVAASCSFAIEMLTWTRKLTLLLDGARTADPRPLERVARLGISVEHRRVARLEGSAQTLQTVVLRDETRIPCHALFLLTVQRQRNGFAEKLGCSLVRDDRTVRTDELQHTRTRGVYAAGNAAVGLQAAILAAAEGFKAAYAINDELIEDFVARQEAASPGETLQR
ncbi:NAD(P)/FAD-dependent oxidoreductase [Opitutaceae bacterium EW11]|nr:NAD(P)/FAD-dependent oxidoreductase [Opitutaceae bacterium EW11]